MWQTKYASAVPKNLRVGVNFWLCSAGRRFPHRASVVRALNDSNFSDFGPAKLFLTLVLTKTIFEEGTLLTEA